jgi:hypothetical protein
MAGRKSQTHKGNYALKNPEKYIGTNTGNVTYRSSWEYSVMTFFDLHPSVIAWSSESISIPYRNPLTGKQTVYIPDFLVVYENKTGGKHAEMIEVKPAKEVPGLVRDKKLSKRDHLAQIINAAKWQAAASFCAKRNIKFRVITEKDLFVFKRK